MHKSHTINAALNMEPLIREVTSQRGKVLLEDANNFRYANNGKSLLTTRWRCSVRTCPATLITMNSTGNLTRETLPTHNHINKLMKAVAKETEKAIINRFATIPKAAPSTVLQEISSNMLASSFPGNII